MNSSFGARLRSQREKKGVSLADISRHTKIKASLLEALERDDLTYWPRGLFGRAYIRAYAQAIGLDPEPWIPEFLELHPDPPDEFWKPDSAEPLGISSAIRSAVGAIPGLLRRTDKTDAAPSAPVETREVPAETQKAPAPPQLTALAALCTRLQRAEGPPDLGPILGTVAQILDASGLVLWLWDPTVSAMKPWLCYGYPPQVVAQLPSVRREDDNAIAATFRTCDTSVVDKGSGETGAIVVPLISGGSRCVGALALELGGGGERRAFVRDAAVIIAMLLVRFVEVVVPLPTAATA